MSSLIAVHSYCVICVLRVQLDAELHYANDYLNFITIF